MSGTALTPRIVKEPVRHTITHELVYGMAKKIERIELGNKR